MWFFLTVLIHVASTNLLWFQVPRKRARSPWVHVRQLTMKTAQGITGVQPVYCQKILAPMKLDQVRHTESSERGFDTAVSGTRLGMEMFWFESWLRETQVSGTGFGIRMFRFESQAWKCSGSNLGSGKHSSFRHWTWHENVLVWISGMKMFWFESWHSWFKSQAWKSSGLNLGSPFSRH